MSSEMSSLELGADDIRERDGQLQLVKGLNESRFEAICLLLQGQSPADMRDFETSVARFMKRGYQLTSLVAELGCPAGTDVLKTWTWAVRPKIGAKPRKMNQ